MMILHILFTLLKIIGILILVILGILLLAVLTVLFVPVRYEGEVGVKNSVSSIRARGTVTWFFRLIRGRFQYKNGKLHYELRILWKKLGNSTVDDKSVKNETVEVENPKKRGMCQKNPCCLIRKKCQKTWKSRLIPSRQKNER